MRTPVTALIAIAVLMSAAPLPAQAPSAVLLRPADIVLQPAPPVLEPGAQAAILAGNPAQGGVIVLRVRVPDQYRIAAHRHPVDEYVTVLAGTLCLALGEQGATPASCIGAGGFAVIPANVPHSVSASGATEYQVQVFGSFEMIYVNAADDPSRRRN